MQVKFAIAMIEEARALVMPPLDQVDGNIRNDKAGSARHDRQGEGGGASSMATLRPAHFDAN